jgi:hypothetical protein
MPQLRGNEPILGLNILKDREVLRWREAEPHRRETTKIVDFGWKNISGLLDQIQTRGEHNRGDLIPTIGSKYRKLRIVD